MNITIQMLHDKGACPDQVALFEELFGDVVEVTEEACIAVAGSFDWAWAARNLLTAPARVEYERVTAPARVEYERVTAAAWAEYERVTAAAWAEYDRVTAAAFARAFLSQNTKEAA